MDNWAYRNIWGQWKAKSEPDLISHHSIFQGDVRPQHLSSMPRLWKKQPQIKSETRTSKDVAKITSIGKVLVSADYVWQREIDFKKYPLSRLFFYGKEGMRWLHLACIKGNTCYSNNTVQYVYSQKSLPWPSAKDLPAIPLIAAKWVGKKNTQREPCIFAHLYATETPQMIIFPQTQHFHPTQTVTPHMHIHPTLILYYKYHTFIWHPQQCYPWK